MSKTTEIFAKDLIEAVMMNAVNFSITEMDQDKANKIDDDSEIKNPSSEVIPQLLSQHIPQTNMNITQILQQVAELAENLREDLQNIQIGDYVISMNASPLEIQVKQAISSLQVPEDESANKIIITKGEGDGERRDLTTDDVTNEQISVNKCNNKPLSDPLTSSSPLSNAISTLNAMDPPLDLDQQLNGSLKRKKYMTLGERIRRIFRFTFSRRRNL